jgi:hypothetical protein
MRRVTTHTRIAFNNDPCRQSPVASFCRCTATSWATQQRTMHFPVSNGTHVLRAIAKGVHLFTLRQPVITPRKHARWGGDLAPWGRCLESRAVRVRL